MLQQTTVTTVVPYFHKFITRWPTLHSLAQAPLEDIRRLWAGLGYYRRAHFLHACADQLIRKHDGLFPKTPEELQKLPGLGPYTSAAIAAIAFNQRANVVDGNVERVITRIFALKTPLPQSKSQIRKAAESLLPEERFGDYAQALMDLGATLCVPQNPKCGLCPWQSNCKAHSQNLADKLPYRRPKAPKPHKRAIAFLLITQEGEVFIRRRPDKGLLANMMEIPSSAWMIGPMPTLTEVSPEAPIKAQWQLLPGRVHHVFSHFELELAVATASISKTMRQKIKTGRWVSYKNLPDEALPSIMRKIVSHAKDAIIPE